MLNRRNFLRNVSLAGFGFTLAPAVKAEKPLIGPSTDLTPLLLQGKVRSSGKGIAGVAVTDGINVTVTRKDGSYELASNNSAEFVYISIPSGYAFSTREGSAVFYKPVTKGGKTFSADFEIGKLSADDSKHNFVVWADTQIISKDDAAQLKAESAPDLKQLVEGYPSGTLFHGIGCGDLVWDKFELFADYKEAIQMTGIPFFNVIGNHDMDLDSRTDDGSAQTFKKHFGPTYYSYNRGSIHYVVLDDVFFIGKAKRYIGYVTENQLRWLEQDLALVKPGTTVVVSVHIPPETGAARRNQKEEELGGTVSNRQQLYKILEPFKVHIMSGHTHVNEKLFTDKIMGHVHGTVCGAWWTGPICTDGSPSGYAVYEVDGPDISWYYKSTGKPREHQLRVYPRGAAAEFPDEVVANVWNWDESWKVEWLEDGVLKGEMERRTSLDPLAVQLYTGNQLPQKHKWVEPNRTDHLFYARVSPAAKEIVIRATDRFGKVYTGNLEQQMAATTA